MVLLGKNGSKDEEEKACVCFFREIDTLLGAFRGIQGDTLRRKGVNSSNLQLATFGLTPWSLVYLDSVL